MAAPSTRCVVGIVKSTNAALSVRTVGFRPLKVELFAGGNYGHWQKGMADDSAQKRVAAGTGSLITSDGITPLSDGFTIGADAELNPASETDIHYTCWAE